MYTITGKSRDPNLQVTDRLPQEHLRGDIIGGPELGLHSDQLRHKLPALMRHACPGSFIHPTIAKRAALTGSASLASAGVSSHRSPALHCSAPASNYII
jgi:hypothetical protein